ncbi:MAG TPA: hypothetical protein VLL54_20550 [Pyrinomonadaceae bacterium]|nr:hypothetical protein [Pyrinomonadaceae bacterium]
MYCSTCGVSLAAGLSYCNYCGEKLADARNESIAKSSEVKPGTLVGAMVFAFVFGLAAITMLMGMLKVVVRLESGLVIAFALLSFFILITLEAVFIRLLFRRKSTIEEVDAVRLPGQTTRELNARHAGMLPEPLPSVTEHTTRAFDSSYVDRTSK